MIDTKQTVVFDETFCEYSILLCCLILSVSSAQMLFRSVQESLWLAVAAQHSSIAFPAIGTGNLGFSDHEAARIMMNSMWTFAQNSPQKIDVHFVIFPSDSERYKVRPLTTRAVPY